MEKIKLIKLSEFFERQISGRSAVTAIFSEIQGVHHLILDFTGIQFISRSAAHELITKMEEVQKKLVSVELSSPTKEVSEMLSKVRASMKNPQKLATYVEFLTFSSEKESDEFLLSY